MPSFTSGVSNFNQLAGVLALAQVPAEMFTADAAGRAKFANLFLDAAKLAADAVEESKILNANVTAGKIGVDAVTMAKILSRAEEFTIVPGLNNLTIIQGTWSEELSSTHAFNHRIYNTSSNDGDAFSIPVLLKAGTYTVYCYTQRGSASAIVTIDFDGTDIDDVDTYGATDNDHLFAWVGGVVATGGVVTMGVRANGKNVASSDYILYPQAFILVKTA